jgi:hypothetical protein
MKEAWSAGVLEEWSRIEGRFFKVRPAAKKLSSMQLLRRVLATMFSNVPIIQYSTSLREKE